MFWYQEGQLENYDPLNLKRNIFRDRSIEKKENYLYTFTQQLCYEEGFSLLALGPLPLGNVEPSVRGGPCRWTTQNLGLASSGQETPNSGTSHLLL